MPPCDQYKLDLLGDIQRKKVRAGLRGSPSCSDDYLVIFKGRRLGQG